MTIGPLLVSNREDTRGEVLKRHGGETRDKSSKSAMQILTLKIIHNTLIHPVSYTCKDTLSLSASRYTYYSTLSPVLL